MDKLTKCEANYPALTPISFLKRASVSYADRTSIIYGETRFTWQQTHRRCCRLASSLHSLGVTKNDVVSVLAPNVPAVYEMHFGVPMLGAVLNTINTMLDANTIKTILHHSDAKFLFIDYEYMPLATKALNLLKNELLSLPSIVIISEIGSSSNYTNNSVPLEYEQLILTGNPNFVAPRIDDEWSSIALNYTSGTTSSPKGVVTSHRGAYLNALSMLLAWNMGTEPIYLWTLPMFHGNGWTFTWAIAARGGTNVCIRKVTATSIYSSIAQHGVTHMCCAPVVFNILRESNPEERVINRSRVQILTGGAPPTAELLKEIEEMGFHVVHAYGLTEATACGLICEWQESWDDLPHNERAKLKARQGISLLAMSEVDVKDLTSMKSVPYDGVTKGEILLRGSGLMKGYLKDEKATSEAFKDGWLHTGDVGVVHPNGYIELKDRLKDVIISGGENISSIEVESVIYKLPDVVEVAVVAMPHPKWGESPCAFVVKKVAAEELSVEKIIGHCRGNLPHFMVPKMVVFVKELPKTSTGKLRKGMLRDFARKIKLSSPKNAQQIGNSRL